MSDIQWFKDFIASDEAKTLHERPIVYFCAEYAINDELPIYAGGLGVLAGDIIREAAQQSFPLISVGLYYYEGYRSHDLYKEGIMMKNVVAVNPADTSLKPVVDDKNNRIIVTIPIQDKQIHIQAWSMKIGTVTVYLLDTRIAENDEEGRQITDYLYASSKETRFKQEMVLALGGLRLLEALKISPTGYHLNEGHSALLALEIARHEMRKHKRTFQEELQNTKEHIFFTNHTLVNAGNDTFNTDLVAALLSGFAKELGVPTSEIIKLGTISGSSIFSMTLLALRMAGKANAVSKLHAEKAKEIWTDHPMIPITNGIHVQTWDKIYSSDQLWANHLVNKRELLGHIYKETGEEWDENVLLLGWARRIVGYKRPLALFDNLAQFKKLAQTTDRPIRVVISGLSHESDTEGEIILEHIQKLVNEDLKGIVTYLPGHRMTNAKLLVAGCDVWLNTPIVGFEACGTSGMKAALNGVLTCSTNDGWVAEANLFDVGWLLKSENLSFDVLGILEKEIIPSFFSRNDKNIPEKWVSMMKNSREMVLNQFSATTMLRKYIEAFYIPRIQAHLAQRITE